MPWILWGRGVASQRIGGLASQVDVFPTLVDVCGLAPLPDLDGRTLTPYLLDPARTDGYAITEFRPGQRAVRTRHHRYIRYEDGSEELYDLKRDPHEWVNLAGKQEVVDTQASLRDRLAPYVQ